MFTRSSFLIQSTFIVRSMLLLGCLFTLPAFAHNERPCPDRLAPASIANTTMVLQIEKSQSTLAQHYPYKGAIVKHYYRDGKYTAQGTGTMKGQVSAAEQYSDGIYRYQKTGPDTAIEKSIDSSTNQYVTVKYTFESERSGTWAADFDNGQSLISGTFTQEPLSQPESEGFAPATNTGNSLALVIKHTSSDLPTGTYPSAGLVLQTYAQDGSMIFKGFGPGTINSTGTYQYTKISANSAVEEVTQTSDFFTLPYTMVYTFETPSSGRWFQNFADGLILFSGTFDTFPAQ